jgi:hypothetical protein
MDEITDKLLFAIGIGGGGIALAIKGDAIRADVEYMGAQIDEMLPAFFWRDEHGKTLEPGIYLWFGTIAMAGDQHAQYKGVILPATEADFREMGVRLPLTVQR